MQYLYGAMLSVLFLFGLVTLTAVVYVIAVSYTVNQPTRTDAGPLVLLILLGLGCTVGSTVALYNFIKERG